MNYIHVLCMNYLSSLRTNNTNLQTETLCISYERMLHFLTNLSQCVCKRNCKRSTCFLDISCSKNQNFSEIEKIVKVKIENIYTFF